MEYLLANACEDNSLGQGKNYPRGLWETIPGAQTGSGMVYKLSYSAQGGVHRGFYIGSKEKLVLK